MCAWLTSHVEQIKIENVHNFTCSSSFGCGLTMCDVRCYGFYSVYRKSVVTFVHCLFDTLLVSLESVLLIFNKPASKIYCHAVSRNIYYFSFYFRLFIDIRLRSMVFSRPLSLSLARSLYSISTKKLIFFSDWIRWSFYSSQSHSTDLHRNQNGSKFVGMFAATKEEQLVKLCFRLDRKGVHWQHARSHEWNEYVFIFGGEYRWHVTSTK